MTSSVEEYGEIGRQAFAVAKQNPAAFALVAAGLGLLFTATGTNTERARPAPSKRQAYNPQAATDGFDARVAAADAAIKADMGSDDMPKSTSLKAHLESGLDPLPNSARRRVIKARKAAVTAQERVESEAAKLKRNSQAFYAKQPLAVGGLALGIGALVGSLLPSTRGEDALLGKHRDELMAKAQRALEEEAAALKDSMKEGVSAAANHSEARERRRKVGI